MVKIIWNTNGDKKEYRYVNDIPIGRKLSHKNISYPEKEENELSEIEEEENLLDIEESEEDGYEECSYTNGVKEKEKEGEATYCYFGGDIEKYTYEI